MLEAQSHSYSSFNTFTYEVEPDGRFLNKAEFSASLHRLRELARRSSGRAVRFYGIGEYGDQLGRPHYHAAIFGLLPEDAPLIDRAWTDRTGCVPASGKPGFVHHGALTPQSAEYITGYVTKKLTKSDDPRLDGRPPEFAVMSRRPGIGTPSIVSLIETLNTADGALYIARFKDVPAAFQVGTRLLPLGGHIRRLLRLHFFGEETQPKAAKAAHNRRFYENIEAHLPPLPIHASEAEKLALWFEAQAEARDAYLASLRQKERKLKSKTLLRKSKESL